MLYLYPIHEEAAAALALSEQSLVQSVSLPTIPKKKFGKPRMVQPQIRINPPLSLGKVWGPSSGRRVRDCRTLKPVWEKALPLHHYVEPQHKMFQQRSVLAKDVENKLIYSSRSGIIALFRLTGLL